MLTMEETFIVTGIAVLVVGAAVGFLAYWIGEKENGKGEEDGK